MNDTPPNPNVDKLISSLSNIGLLMNGIDECIRKLSVISNEMRKNLREIEKILKDEGAYD